MNNDEQNQNSNNEQSVAPPANRTSAFLWLILFVLTLGHPERANTQKIGNRKTDIIVYSSIVLIATLVVVLYIAIKKP